MLLLVSLGHLSIYLRLIKCHLPFIWIFLFLCLLMLFYQRCIEERTCIQKSGVFLVVIFWPRKSLLMCLGLCRTSEWWFFGPVQYRTAVAALCGAAPPHCAEIARKWAKNKYVSKCLELSNSSRNPIKNFDRTVRPHSAAKMFGLM